MARMEDVETASLIRENRRSSMAPFLGPIRAIRVIRGLFCLIPAPWLASSALIRAICIIRGKLCLIPTARGWAKTGIRLAASRPMQY
jgi:hypothetical protein